MDLLAVLPFWFAFALPADLRVLLVFRIVRFLKLARYSPAMRSLLDAVYRERRALFGCFVILLGATLLAASVMHLIERHAQPDKFGTIPDAMWWAIVTLGTIGYGDVVPITLLGQIVASVTIFVGLIMVALPIGIVATAFADEIHRRDFIVTWSMVARVPLFAELQASDIADIMRLLRAQQVEPGVVIARRGDPAHSMYFVAAGEVEIELKRESIRLGAGHFFGEVAALRRARRSGTVTAVTRTSLLVLDAHDLHALMDREPRIAERIREVVRSRIGRDIVTAKGDVVSEELEETLHPTAGNHARLAVQRTRSFFVRQYGIFTLISEEAIQQTGLEYDKIEWRTRGGARRPAHDPGRPERAAGSDECVRGSRHRAARSGGRAKRRRLCKADK